jgi:large conductance mechanosensitive channel
MGLASEFREFVRRGNVIDLAVGVIMGAAFGKIVSSLVADVLMPPIGYLIGGVQFSGLSIKLASEGADGKPVLINYGNFLQTLFDFGIIAFCIFLVVKAVNQLNRKEPTKPAEMTTSEKLLTEIRDLLKQPRP